MLLGLLKCLPLDLSIARIEKEVKKYLKKKTWNCDPRILGCMPFISF